MSFPHSANMNCTDYSGNVSVGCGMTVPYEEQPYYLQSKNLILYGIPPLVLLGAIGNILSVLVMTRKTLRNHTTSLYLVVLAAVDTSALFVGMFYYWAQVLSGVRAERFSSYQCNKARIFFIYFLPQFESWILASVAVERMTAVYFPFKVKAIFTKKFAAIQVAVTGLLIAAVNMSLFWTANTVETGCYVDVVDEQSTSNTFWTQVWPWIHFFLTTLIPFVVMLTIDVAIIGKMICMNRHRKNNLNASSDVKTTGMTTILLTVTFVFFATSMPLTVFLGTRKHWEDQAETVEDDARLGLVLNYVLFVAYINYAINFWLYCLSARRFREECFKMLRLDKLRVHCRQLVQSNESSTQEKDVETACVGVNL